MIKANNKKEKTLFGYDLTLERWLELMMRQPENIFFINYQFPTDKLKEQFLTDISRYSEEVITKIITSFLPPSEVLRSDHSNFEYLMLLERENKQEAEKIYNSTSYYKRLKKSISSRGRIPFRDSIIWILDLLPYYPREALNVVDAYLTTNIAFLPDGRIHGLSDVKAILRTRYFTTDNKSAHSVLNSLSPIDLEHLAEALYRNMHFNTKMTKSSYDGGRDIIATKDEPGKKEKNLIQCKKWQNIVGVEDVRSLHGVVADDKATKGTLITTSHFSPEAKKWANKNPQIELISTTILQKLLDEHLGVTWITNTDLLILESKKRHPLDKRE